MIFFLPMRKSPKRYNVTLIFPTSAISKIEKMSGVFRFLSEGHRWNLSIVAPDAQSPDFSSSDGIIVTGAPSPGMRRAIEQTDVPTVAIAVDFIRSHQLLHVTTDGESIGRDVAETFLRYGIFRGFAFVCPTKTTTFQELYRKSFLDNLVRAGAIVATVAEDNFSELWDLPRPLMVFAATDYIAARTVDAGLNAGLRIPGDLSVLGFLNDTVFCENHEPQISSLELDFERQGYLAAKSLQALMAGKHVRDKLTAGLKTIVRRDTTPAPTAGDALVRRGIEFIRRRTLQPTTVKDVVAHLKVSRRLAELRFREITNRTILSVILDEKLDATKRLLKSSDESIGEVCKRCGWKSENYPKRLFREKFGQTMLEWRTNAER